VRYTLLAIGLLGLLGSWLAIASQTSRPNIEIVDPWVYETTGPTAMLHATITNIGVKGDRLIRASAGLAASVAILNALGQQGDGFMIPADAEFVIGADVPRVELIGLTRSLKARDTFQLLLVFQRAGKARVNVRVEAVPGASPRAAN